MKKIIIILLMLLFVTFSFAHDKNVPHYVNMTNPTGLVNPDGFFEYLIVKGDCLWFLADRFYSNPFKWTKIHKANPYIIDPDWIYTNNWLVIPSVFADSTGKLVYGLPPTKATVSSEPTMLVLHDNDGNAIIDESGDIVVIEGYSVDLNRDGVIDGYDTDGDGTINVATNDVVTLTDYNTAKAKAAEEAALATAYGIDSDGDGVIDGVDLDGDGMLNEQAGIDLDGDGVIDGYDIDGDGNIDVKAGAAVLAATTAAAATTKSELEEDDVDIDESSIESYCGKPGWKLGLHAGYPLGSAPEDETLNLGLLLGTPLGVKVGPLSVGLGAGAFTYDFDKYYFGAGLLASLCINDLLKLDMPLILQLHGAGFYVFGEGLGFGVIGSGSVPLGESPLSLGLYGALGKYYPNVNDYNWSNVGAVLFYSL